MREHAEALLAAVVVIGGKHGGGFSVQATPHGLQTLAMLPALLRNMAEQIEGSFSRT